MNLAALIANAKPEFASKKEAIDAYTEKLDSLAKRCGKSVSEMLTKAENSPEFDEDCEQAMSHWITLSFLKRKQMAKHGWNSLAAFWSAHEKTIRLYRTRGTTVNAPFDSSECILKKPCIYPRFGIRP